VQNPTVKLGKHSLRWPLWLFAAALLLKSAMPFLASASAQMQGKALVEVCTVYGVALVPQGGDAQQPPADHGSARGGDHCVLTALAALATGAPEAAAPIDAPQGGVEVRLARHASPGPDASAIWVARLKHGPPNLS
jgi:hypothetical protein